LFRCGATTPASPTSWGRPFHRIPARAFPLTIVLLSVDGRRELYRLVCERPDDEDLQSIYVPGEPVLTWIEHADGTNRGEPLMSQIDSLPAYATTVVPVSRSQEEIRHVLRRHEAASFQFGEATHDGQRFAGVEFSHQGHRVVMFVPIKVPTAAMVEQIERKSHKKRGWLDPEPWAGARTWRVIAWTLRSRTIAVEEGVETFEQAFLPHIVNPATGRTIYSELADEGRIDLGTALPQLSAGR